MNSPRPSRAVQPPKGDAAKHPAQTAAPVAPIRPIRPIGPVESVAPVAALEAGSSEGMPTRTPATGRSRPGQSVTPQDASDESSLALPHERDQTSNMTAAQPDPQIRQAARDLKQNLQDTDKSAAMNQTYQKLKRP
jgi:hypothetical protein